MAGSVGLIVSIGLTPVPIRVFSKQGSARIRVEGPESHQTKRGTPSMGGVAIVTAIVAAYFSAHIVGYILDDSGPTASGMLVLGLTVMLALVGFLDDIIKVRKQRNLGLNKTAKSVGQAVAAILFGVLVLRFRNSYGYTPASEHLSYARDISAISLAGLGGVVFVLFVWFVVAAWSNAVNFTDGLDGLAAGSMAMVMGSYVLITYWQYRNACQGGAAGIPSAPGCYPVRDPLISPSSPRPVVPPAWLPLVERRAREDLHGRHGVARPRRIAGGAVHRQSHRAGRGRPGRAVRHGDDLGGAADPGLPDIGAPTVPNGAIPPPLRTRRLG